jgi:hypothetical protein
MPTPTRKKNQPDVETETEVETQDQEVAEVVEEFAIPNPPSRRGPKKGYEGPRLMWGMVVDGRPNALDIALVQTAREVSQQYNGRATLTDVLKALRQHPDFTGTQHPDGTPLSDLLTITNVRNRWAHLRDRFVSQMSQKPASEGGLELPADAKLTKEQRHEMEARIARPKPEGRDFPRLVIVRGGKGEKGISLDDI